MLQTPVFATQNVGIGLPQNTIQVDESETGSIEIELTDGGIGTSKKGVVFEYVKVAEINDGSYHLLSQYSDSKIDLNKIVQLCRRRGKDHPAVARLCHSKMFEFHLSFPPLSGRCRPSAPAARCPARCTALPRPERTYRPRRTSRRGRPGHNKGCRPRPVPALCPLRTWDNGDGGCRLRWKIPADRLHRPGSAPCPPLRPLLFRPGS